MVPAAARSFLQKYIESAEQLDVLMQLHFNPQERWNAESMSRAIFSVPQSSQRRLDELAARGLACENPDAAGCYQLCTLEAAEQAGLAALADAYRTSRAQVITELFGMSRDPLRSFSNAFRLRGDQ